MYMVWAPSPPCIWVAHHVFCSRLQVPNLMYQASMPNLCRPCHGLRLIGKLSRKNKIDTAILRVCILVYGSRGNNAGTPISKFVCSSLKTTQPNQLEQAPHCIRKSCACCVKMIRVQAEQVVARSLRHISARVAHLRLHQRQPGMPKLMRACNGA
jgi:hypothetical protein